MLDFLIQYICPIAGGLILYSLYCDTKRAIEYTKHYLHHGTFN